MRIRRSKRRSVRWRSSCAPGRSSTSVCQRQDRRRSAARTKCTRSPPCSRNGRCGREIPKTRCCRRCRELGIGFVAYSPLGRGFLAGRFSSPTELADDDFRRNHPRMQDANFDAESPARGARPRARSRERLHAGPARARVGALARRGCRPDSRHEAPDLPRAERRRFRARAERRRPSRARRGLPARRRGGRSLRRHVVDRPLRQG